MFADTFLLIFGIVRDEFLLSLFFNENFIQIIVILYHTLKPSCTLNPCSLTCGDELEPSPTGLCKCSSGFD